MRNRSESKWHKLLVVAGALLVGLSAVGCQKSAEDKLRSAQNDINRAENLDEAEKTLDEVAEKFPFESKLARANLHQAREEWDQGAEVLEKLWQDQGFKGKKRSELESKKARSRMTQLKQETMLYYTDWLDVLEKKGNDEKIVEVAKQGLEYDETSTDLNRLLVDHYMNKGKSLRDKGDKLKAAEAYEEVLDLQAPKTDRDTAEKRVQKLRREAFHEKGKKNFEQEVKPRLGGMDGFNLEDETIDVDFDVDVNRQLDPDNEKHAKLAKKKAFLGLMSALGNKIIAPIAGLPEEADLTIIGNQKLLGILTRNLDELNLDFTRGEATVTAKLPVDKAIGMGSDLEDAYKKAKKKKEEQKQAKKKEGKKGEKAEDGKKKEGDEGSGDSEGEKDGSEG